MLRYLIVRRLRSAWSSLGMLLFCGCLSSQTFAADIFFDVASGDWNLAANWNGGAGPLPSSADWAIIEGGRTAVIGGVLTNNQITELVIGTNIGPAPGPGAVAQHRGLLAVSGDVLLGDFDNGSYTLDGTGTLVVSGSISTHSIVDSQLTINVDGVNGQLVVGGDIWTRGLTVGSAGSTGLYTQTSNRVRAGYRGFGATDNRDMAIGTGVGSRGLTT